jgi:hypothetical protein
MARTHTLPDGKRVRLRMARARDEEALRVLLRRRPRRHGADPRALAHFDPRHRVVVCATALVGSSQEIVGMGAADLNSEQPPEVVIAEDQSRELAELLRRTLDGRIRAHRR